MGSAVSLCGTEITQAQGVVHFRMLLLSYSYDYSPSERSEKGVYVLHIELG